MKVLSIDLDFIMTTLDDEDVADMHPVTNWEIWWNRKQEERDLEPNVNRLLWTFDVFTKALQHCHDVDFAHDHDGILYRLENEDNIDIINIDHHNDITNGAGHWPGGHRNATYEQDVGCFLREYDNFKNNRVMEGNWLGWLHAKNKLSKMTWIHDDDTLINYSADKMEKLHQCMMKGEDHCSRREHLARCLNELKLPNEDLDKPVDLWEVWRKHFYGEKYETVHVDNFKFTDYKFDYIFVCLSPQYIPTQWWYQFTMFMIAYENMTGKKLRMFNKKYEISARYKDTNKYIFPNKLYNAKTY